MHKRAMSNDCCGGETACCSEPKVESCGCESVGRSVETGSAAFRRTVWIVLALNAAMFVVEIVAGRLAGSLALQSDALDFAGDTATYAISLAVVGHSLAWRARAALLKGVVLGGFAVFVLASAVWRAFIVGVPAAETMGVVGLMALAVNVTAALLLLRFRDGDANVRSVWLCSRNDALGNIAVLIAAGVVAVTGTKWADLAVAAIMASLFLSTAVQITRQAKRELRMPLSSPAEPAQRREGKGIQVRPAT
jgi:cation diffusion facilitator family transporter